MTERLATCCCLMRAAMSAYQPRSSTQPAGAPFDGLHGNAELRQDRPRTHQRPEPQDPERNRDPHNNDIADGAGATGTLFDRP